MIRKEERALFSLVYGVYVDGRKDAIIVILQARIKNTTEKYNWMNITSVWVSQENFIFPMSPWKMARALQ